MGKCLKDVWEITLKVDLWGLLGNPHGGRGDIKDVRIGRVSEKRNNLALEKGHIKHTEQYQDFRARAIRRERLRGGVVLQTSERFGVGSKR